MTTQCTTLTRASYVVTLVRICITSIVRQQPETALTKVYTGTYIILLSIMHPGRGQIPDLCDGSSSSLFRQFCMDKNPSPIWQTKQQRSDDPFLGPDNILSGPRKGSSLRCCLVCQIGDGFLSMQNCRNKLLLLPSHRSGIWPRPGCMIERRMIYVPVYTLVRAVSGCCLTMEVIQMRTNVTTYDALVSVVHCVVMIIV